MAAVARGLVLAFALFAASFALHIVGGATDQGWLFAIAVALIYAAATGFPAIAVILSGASTRLPRRITAASGAVIGVVLTASALWAANGRTFAWWEPILALPLVAATSSVLWLAWRRFRPGDAGRSASVGRVRPSAG